MNSSLIKPAILGVIGFFCFSAGSGVVALIGCVFLVGAVWSAFRALSPKSTAANSALEEIRTNVEPLQYKSIHGKSGIGIDPAKKVLHLLQNGNYRVYPFADIRGWSANIQTGGEIIGGGNLATGPLVIASNLRTQRDNRDNTGFFIEVRDIDFPKWKVDFPGDLKKNHERWMEIFRQYVNES